MRERGLKLLVVLLAVLMAALFWWDYAGERRQQAYYEKLEREASPYRLEQTELEQRLVKLEREYESGRTGQASLELVFVEPTEEMLSRVEPLMAERGMSGVLALSEEQLSGRAKMPEREHLLELLKQGWDWCLYYDGKREPERWLEAASAAVETVGIEPTFAVYFAEEAYETEAGETLAEGGISMVVHHGEEELPLVVDAESDRDGLWLVGACWWNGERTRALLTEALAQGKNLVFEVSEAAGSGAPDGEQFRAMLVTLADYEKKDGLMVTGLKQAMEYQQNKPGELAGAAERYERERTELERKVEDVQREIDRVYEK